MTNLPTMLLWTLATITSNIERLYPSEVLITVQGKKSKALADQIATVSKLRVLNLLDSLSDADLRAVESAVRRQLDL